MWLETTRRGASRVDVALAFFSCHQGTVAGNRHAAMSVARRLPSVRARANFHALRAENLHEIRGIYDCEIYSHFSRLHRIA